VDTRGFREALPKFVDMREPAAYDEWRLTLAELGLTSEERTRNPA